VVFCLRDRNRHTSRPCPPPHTDRCGAQAYVRVVLASGDLLFCGHHAKAYEDKLKQTAVDWVDETATLS